MVGVLLDNKCDTCRKRKKKCDGQKPSCSECQRSGWPCPGYQTQWKFIDEVQALSKQYARRTYVFDDVDPILDATFFSKLENSILPFERIVLLSSEVNHIRSRKIQNRRPKTTKLELLLSPSKNILGSKLVYCVQSDVGGNLIPLNLIGCFFDFVPARLGYNSTLDAAVSCLCALYLKGPTHRYTFDPSVNTIYLNAIASLRLSLNDEVQQLQSEILCASILLMFCELIINVSKKDWSKLLEGTARLIEHRGVQRYKNPFDFAMLDSQMGLLLALYFKSGYSSFLCRPEWQNLFSMDQPHVRQLAWPRTLRVRSHLSIQLVNIPGLIRRSIVLVGSGILTTLPDHIDLLIHEAWNRMDSLSRWLLADDGPVCNRLESCESTSQSLEPQYLDIIDGVSDCVSHMALLALDATLRSLYQLRGASGTTRFLETEDTTTPGRALIDPSTIDQWQKRVASAFQFVEGESKIAVKPLEYGIGHFQKLIMGVAVPSTQPGPDLSSPAEG